MMMIPSLRRHGLSRAGFFSVAAAAPLAVAAVAVPPHSVDGLCGIPWLRTNSDFGRAGVAARTVCLALVHALEADPTRGLHTLQQLDCISDALCKVLDCAEFVRQNHADEAWKGSADRVYRDLASLMHGLNAHKPLHDALVAITGDVGAMGRLSPQQQRMAVLLQAEFERDGIHLPDAERLRLVALNDASAEFVASITGGEKTVEVGRERVYFESSPLDWRGFVWVRWTPSETRVWLVFVRYLLCYIRWTRPRA